MLYRMDVAAGGSINHVKFNTLIFLKNNCTYKTQCIQLIMQRNEIMKCWSKLLNLKIALLKSHVNTCHLEQILGQGLVWIGHVIWSLDYSDWVLVKFWWIDDLLTVRNSRYLLLEVQYIIYRKIIKMFVHYNFSLKSA